MQTHKSGTKFKLIPSCHRAPKHARPKIGIEVAPPPEAATLTGEMETRVRDDGGGGSWIFNLQERNRVAAAAVVCDDVELTRRS